MFAIETNETVMAVRKAWPGSVFHEIQIPKDEVYDGFGVLGPRADCPLSIPMCGCTSANDSRDKGSSDD